MLQIFFLLAAMDVFTNGNIYGDKTKYVPKYLQKCAAWDTDSQGHV